MVVRHDRLRADLATRRSRLKWVGVWTIVTALGWSIPATAVVVGFSGHEDGDLAFLALVVASSLTGVPVGVGQWLVLRRWMPAASRWIVATALGWLVAFPIGLVVGFVMGLAVFATIGVMIGGFIGMVQGESWSYVGAFTALIGPFIGLAIAGTVVGTKPVTDPAALGGTRLSVDTDYRHRGHLPQSRSGLRLCEWNSAPWHPWHLPVRSTDRVAIASLAATDPGSRIGDGRPNDGECGG